MKIIRLDVAASGLWGGRRERTLMDVRVFNPFAPSNRNNLVYPRPMLQEAREGKDSCIRIKDKRSRVCYFRSHCDVCHWRPFETSYKLLQMTGLPAHRQIGPTLQHHPACSLSFSLLRSAIQCIRGARSSRGHPTKLSPVDLHGYSRGQLAAKLTN